MGVPQWDSGGLCVSPRCSIRRQHMPMAHLPTANMQFVYSNGVKDPERAVSQMALLPWRLSAVIFPLPLDQGSKGLGRNSSDHSCQASLIPYDGEERLGPEMHTQCDGPLQQGLPQTGLKHGSHASHLCCALAIRDVRQKVCPSEISPSQGNQECVLIKSCCAIPN